MGRFFISLAILTALAPSTSARGAAQPRATLDLNGRWEFRADPDDLGVKESWFAAGAKFERDIVVPGAWNAQGVRYQSEDKLRAYEQAFLNGKDLLGSERESDRIHNVFPGPAWYRKRVKVPASFAGKTIWLSFDGVHRYAEVWVDGQSIGSHGSYLSAFRFDVTSRVTPGKDMTVVVRVDARRNQAVDPLMGCLDTLDFLYVSWGGIYRPVFLEATAPAHIDDVFAMPRLRDETAVVTVTTGGTTDSPRQLRVVVRDAAGAIAGNGEATLSGAAGPAAIPVHLPGPKLWSPRTPHLYTALVSLFVGDKEVDRVARRFGMRELVVESGKFLLNGKPIFLRGYGDDAIYPKTIAPPVDRAEYRRRLSIARDYGFNYVRHHSWFPPDEYFDVADELGMMIQPEFPFAYRWTLPKTPQAQQRALVEWESVITRYRNHPSIVTWGMGNEQYNSFEQAPAMYEIARRTDPSRLVIDSDGCQFKHKDRKTLDFLVVQFNEATSCGYGDKKYDVPADVGKPVVSHEMGYFATLPDLGQLPLFGNGIRPYWLLQTRDLVKTKNLASVYPQWREASYRLHALSLKTNTEAARRSRLSGFSLWLFHDYPNVAEGVVDMFWRPKGVSAAEFRKWNAPTVLLLDTPRRNFNAGEIAPVKIVVSRFEDKPSENATLRWQLRAGATTLSSATVQGLHVAADGVHDLVPIGLQMPTRPRAEKLTLSAVLIDENGVTSNDWSFWIFPKESLAGSSHKLAVAGVDTVKSAYPWAVAAEGAPLGEGDLLVTARLDTGARAHLDRGGRVLLLGPETVFPTVDGRFRAGSWDPSHKGDHSGTIFDRAHPALRAFPSEGWGDLQVYDLLQKAKVVLLDDIPAKIAPMVRAVDLPHRFLGKAYLFEVRTGKGKLLVSGFNFAQALAAQDRAASFLLDQLIRYGLGPDFAPKTELALSDIKDQAPPPAK